MVVGIEEMGELRAGRSAVLGVLEEVPGAPASLMFLGGGSGQKEHDLLEVVARAWRLKRLSQAAAVPPAAAPRAGGDSAGNRPSLDVHGGSEWKDLLPSYPEVLWDVPLQSQSNTMCGYFYIARDWTSVCTTPWYDAIPLPTRSHLIITLAAIGSTLFLLLQVWYIAVWNEKHNAIMAQLETSGVLPIAQYQDRYEENAKFNLAGYIKLLLFDMYEEANLEMDSASVLGQNGIFSSRCTKLFLVNDRRVEDTAPLFGLCHQRWTTTPLSLIPRFNSRGSSKLGSVMVPQNLQLSSPSPRMHTPDRPTGEPPAGHQLVWSMNEALGDCRCSNIESVLSADERSLFGFIGNLQYHLLVLFCACRHLYSLLGELSSCNVVPGSLISI